MALSFGGGTNKTQSFLRFLAALRISARLANIAAVNLEPGFSTTFTAGYSTF